MDNSYQSGRLSASKQAQIQDQLERRFRGINYAFRPSAYWSPSNLAQVLANIKGAERKRAALRLNLPKDERLLADSLSDHERALASHVHPALMGGEYLPDSGSGEVEIARITMASTTQDVISIRAWPDQQGIAYRVVDEYDSDFTLDFFRSDQPLTLGALIYLIDSTRLEDVGIAVAYLDFMVKECGCDWKDYANFLEFSSEFYPQLTEHYRMAVEEWVRSMRETG